MKVSICENCKHCKKKGWSSYYKPAGYHAIGVPHTYRFCELHKSRCLDIKHCEAQNER